MYACKKCGSVNLRLENKGIAIGLYCNDCNSWIKWVSKKELAQVQNEIEKNVKELNSFKDDKDLTFEYEQVGKREMYHNIQRQIMSIDEDETLNDKQKYELLISVINNLGDALQDTEEVIGDTMKVFNSSEILMDIRLDSIDMQKTAN
jgi:NADH/NAD ratio-sensing transcriptional regulator Rex